MSIVKRLSTDTLIALGERIIERMNTRLVGGTAYGLDWSTARIIFPRMIRRFDKLQAEYKHRNGANLAHRLVSSN